MPLLYGVKWSGPVTSSRDPAGRSAYKIQATPSGGPERLPQINAAQIAAGPPRSPIAKPGPAPGDHGPSRWRTSRFSISATTRPATATLIRLADTSDPATAYTYAPSERVT